MKVLQAGLFLLLTIALAVNFYFDVKTRKALESTLAAKDMQLTKGIEPSPFDKPNIDPYYHNKDVPTGPTTTVKFARIEHDFGKIVEGKKYRTTFELTNTGTQELLISNVVGSCGCTVPSWPEEPIKPGASAEIKIEFNAEGKGGNQTKTVTVTANTMPSKNILYIRALVVPKED